MAGGQLVGIGGILRVWWGPELDVWGPHVAVLGLLLGVCS